MLDSQPQTQAATPPDDRLPKSPPPPLPRCSRSLPPFPNQLTEPAPAPQADAAGALSLSCDKVESATSRTLLEWRVVPADAAGGDDGVSRLELTMDEETLGMLSGIDTKVYYTGRVV